MRRTSPAIGFLVLAGSLALAACRQHAVISNCGAEITPDQLWTERTEAQLNEAIDHARACARQRGSRVLLEFGATWCPDCVMMTRLEQQPTVQSVLRERYERVRINVGRWDPPSESVRRRYGINRIAAYVVLDGHGQLVAQRVMEPATGGTAVTPESWADWLRNPQ